MRKTKLLAIAMAAVVGMSSVPAVYRNVVVAEADETTNAGNSLTFTTFWSAHSFGDEITSTAKTVNFKSKTDSAATKNWHTPLFVIYYGDQNKVGGAGYNEVAVVRSDLYAWSGTANTGNLEDFKKAGFTFETENAPADWAAWLDENKKGVDVSYTTEIKDGKAYITIINNGVKGTLSFTVDTTKKLYISVSGEQCSVSGLPDNLLQSSVAGTYSESDKTTTFPKASFAGWWTNWTDGVKVTSDELKFSYKTTTNGKDSTDKDITDTFMSPVAVLMTSIDGKIASSHLNKTVEELGYKEYAVVRSDCYAWCGDLNTDKTVDKWTEAGYKLEVTGTIDTAWLEANKKGVDVTGTVKREGNTVVLTQTNNGVTYKLTAPVEDGKDAYLAFTGQECTIENLKFESTAIGTPTSDPNPSVAPSTVPSTEPNASAAPSTNPSVAPSAAPSTVPSTEPNASAAPSTNPSTAPSAVPSTEPNASAAPSTNPSATPSTVPNASAAPSTVPSAKPSMAPTKKPSNTTTKKPSNTTTKKLKSATITVKNGKKKVSSVTVKTKKSVKLSVSVNSKAKLSVAKLSKKNAKIAKVTFKKNKLTIKGLKKGKVSIKITSKKTSKYKAATKAIKVTVKK